MYPGSVTRTSQCMSFDITGPKECLLSLHTSRCKEHGIQPILWKHMEKREWQLSIARPENRNQCLLPTFSRCLSKLSERPMVFGSLKFIYYQFLSLAVINFSLSRIGPPRASLPRCSLTSSRTLRTRFRFLISPDWMVFWISQCTSHGMVLSLI